MANLVIKCPNERWAKKLYEKCWKNLLKYGSKIEKHDDILYIEDRTCGDTAQFVYSCLHEPIHDTHMAMESHLFIQALGKSEKDLRKTEADDNV